MSTPCLDKCAMTSGSSTSCKSMDSGVTNWRRVDDVAAIAEFIKFCKSDPGAVGVACTATLTTLARPLPLSLPLLVDDMVAYGTTGIHSEPESSAVGSATQRRLKKAY